MAQTVAKAELHRLIDTLPDEPTWDEVTYLIYFRAKVDAGRAAALKGSTSTTNEIRSKYGLEPLG